MGIPYSPDRYLGVSSSIIFPLKYDSKTRNGIIHFCLNPIAVKVFHNLPLAYDAQIMVCPVAFFAHAKTVNVTNYVLGKQSYYVMQNSINQG